MNNLKETVDFLIRQDDWDKLLRKPEYRDIKNAIIDATNFLPPNSKIFERLYVLHHDMTDRPFCKECGVNRVNWNIDDKCYRSFCSRKCIQQNQDVKSKRADTNINKFGYDNPLKDPNIRERATQTLLERYGVTVPCKSSIIQQRVVETNNIRYGVDYTCISPEVRQKRIATNMIRYGTEYVFQNDEIQNKVRYTIKTRYGVDSTSQVPAIKAQQLETRLQTYLVKYPFREKVQDRNYVDFEYNTNIKSQCQIGETVGCSQSTISRYMRLHQIPCINRNSSSIQSDIYDFIIAVYGGTVHQNDRSLIYPLELDIVIPELRLAFEVNGVYWHSELNGKNKNYHINKTEMCKQIGYQLIHISDTEWLTRTDIVKSRLRSKIGISPNTLYARNLSIRSISASVSASFLDANHIQGSCNSSIQYGLFDIDGRLVSVMTFGKCRFSANYDVELLRFAVLLDHNIVGGASKLFKHFIRNVDVKTVVSYCDLSWNTGTVYKTLGFMFSHNSAPNYKYFHYKNTLVLYNRMQFQKHKLPNILQTFDPSLSEWNNMIVNGYDRIWDCGNSVWIYTKT